MVLGLGPQAQFPYSAIRLYARNPAKRRDFDVIRQFPDFVVSCPLPPILFRTPTNAALRRALAMLSGGPHYWKKLGLSVRYFTTASLRKLLRRTH